MAPDRPDDPYRSGEDLAEQALARHRRFVASGPPRAELEALEDVGPGGILFAEGDSWFAYPGSNVLEALEWHFEYDVRSAAQVSDTLEEMVYDERQLAKVASRLEKMKKKDERPRAVLLSAGGNDIAGDELAIVLNHKKSGLDPLNALVVEGLIGVRLATAWRTFIGVITTMCDRIFGPPVIPILIHGYDHPVPDGRGFLGGFSALPGPWLRPAFRRKGYPLERPELAEERRIMRDLIEIYNQLLVAIDGDHDHVHYVETPGTLRNGPDDYREDWRDELHPTDRGFQAIAALFDEKIREVT